MSRRTSFVTLTRSTAGAAILAVVALACGPAAPPVATPGPTADASASPTTSAIPSANVSFGPAPSVAGLDGPPDAVLSAEGGDPVTGQLGTFIWMETGTDTPWLPGAPLTVGAGEPLTLTLVPDRDITVWRARYVPADAVGPDGAKSLGEGAGDPAFDAPGRGTWTLEVAVEFGTAVGTASYFWRLKVE